MRLPYTYNHPLFPDGLEVEVECDLDWDGGEPTLDVHGVHADDRSLFLSNDDLDQRIGHLIACAAEDDDALLEAALAAEGAWHSGGPGNPDGEWRVA